MEFRKLGNLDVSVIGLGTLRTFDVTNQDEIAVRRQIVDNCLDSDVNLIDTAAWYGNAEQVLGEITENRRDRFFNATNVEDEMLPLAEELGTGILLMEPLQKGRYILGLTPLRDYGIDTRAQALLAWVISDRRVSSAIPTTSRPERVRENTQAAEATGPPQQFRDYIRSEAERCL